MENMTVANLTDEANLAKVTNVTKILLTLRFERRNFKKIDTTKVANFTKVTYLAKFPR